MDTQHRLIISDARQMAGIDDASIDLVLTSPPYPMIEMWDEIFSDLSPDVQKALKARDGSAAFEAMHQVLDPVWQECFRVLKPGGFACINIGDATRTIREGFALYPNHARILTCAQSLGFSAMPCILWRKQTNAPNKYMGSGMLPAGAYVTLEHEYILILRKGGKRVFTKDKDLRRESAMFWEERNLWFSDVWMDLKGSRQALKEQKAQRKRSGAFPLELAFRLINMYSIKGDRVLDPFSGTSTTMAAAMALARHSVGIELDPDLAAGAGDRFKDIVTLGNALSGQRLSGHIRFVADRIHGKGPLKHENSVYGFPVMTAQEKDLRLPAPAAIRKTHDRCWTVSYAPRPQPEFCRDWAAEFGRPHAQHSIRNTIDTEPCLPFPSLPD